MLVLRINTIPDNVYLSKTGHLYPPCGLPNFPFQTSKTIYLSPANPNECSRSPCLDYVIHTCCDWFLPVYNRSVHQMVPNYMANKVHFPVLQRYLCLVTLYGFKCRLGPVFGF